MHTPIEFKAVSKSYTHHEILTGITVTLRPGARVALVGDNGSGKSTLIKILMGIEQPSSGHIIKPDALRLGYVPQELELGPQQTVYDIATQWVRAPLQALQAFGMLLEDFSDDPETAALYDSLQQQVEQGDAYAIQERATKVLSTLDLNGYIESAAINLSGGQKLKLAIARALVTNPDLLILDEPTNHMDLKSRVWLLQLLQDFKGTVLFISHDRAFINAIAEKIWWLDRGKLQVYSGNYDAFMATKAAEENARRQNYEAIERQRKQHNKAMEAMAQKQSRASKSAQKGRSGMPKLAYNAKKSQAETSLGKQQAKALSEKQELADQSRELRPQGAQVLQLSVSKARRLPPTKLRVLCENLAISYRKGSFKLQGINLKLNSGERLAILGDNGSGKSTLVKALVSSDEIEITAGKLSAPENRDIFYLTQNYGHIPTGITVFDYAKNLFPLLEDREIRKHLGRFLFYKEHQVSALTQTLSSGEKARLSLLEIEVKQPKLLILDEPTNNLDITSKQNLAEALQNFPDAMIIISHDQDFIEELRMDEVIEF